VSPGLETTEDYLAAFGRTCSENEVEFLQAINGKTQNGQLKARETEEAG
jgi:hypothetical protein